jgi:hypothetical protein
MRTRVCGQMAAWQLNLTLMGRNRRSGVLFAVALLLLGTGCDEPSETFVFACRVTTAQGQPLEAVEVVLSAQRISGSSFNPNFQTLGTALTDAQGWFTIEVDKAVYTAFRIAAVHPSHFPGTFPISPDDVPISGAFERTFALQPKAWVRTRLLNANASQRIDVTVDAPSDGCDLCCAQLRIIREGEVFDTTFTCLAFGGSTVVHSGNYRNIDGATVIIAQERTTLAYDTVSVEITY